MSTRPETYVSIDIETDGPAPGLYSMLALGAAAFSSETGEMTSTWYATLFPLPDAGQHPDTMAWWATQPSAWAEVQRNRQDPAAALPAFAAWCEVLPGRPVAVGWPIVFDFGFANWYLHGFAHRNPLGFSGCDIRSYANGLAGHPAYHGAGEDRARKLAGYPAAGTGPLSHVAVDDAISQGRLFMALRRLALTRAASG